MKIFKVIVSAIFWSRAVYFSGKGKHQKSLDSLNKAEKFRLKPNEEMLLLKSFLLIALNRDDDSIPYLKASIQAVDKSKFLNNDEKSYLHNYAADLAEIIKIKDSLFYYKQYQSSNVATHLKDKFPLRKRPSS